MRRRPKGTVLRRSKLGMFMSVPFSHPAPRISVSQTSRKSMVTSSPYKSIPLLSLASTFTSPSREKFSSKYFQPDLPCVGCSLANAAPHQDRGGEIFDGVADRFE